MLHGHLSTRWENITYVTDGEGDTQGKEASHSKEAGKKSGMGTGQQGRGEVCQGGWQEWRRGGDSEGRGVSTMPLAPGAEQQGS